VPRITNSFDVVYYPHQVPSFETLTLLSLVFDKIFFPGVYIPVEGIDEDDYNLRKLFPHWVAD